jgi:predicted nucleotidyltransferase
MLFAVEQHLDDLRLLCERHHVRRLDLFGSAAAETGFDPARSDLDFLVEFLPLQPGEHADAYFGLLEGLETLFGRSVDLVMIHAVRNPYFRESVERGRRPVYAA